MTSEPLLRFDNAGCFRGGRMLFSDLSLTVLRGGALIIHGPNGVGKSSLIRLAAGLLEPASGQVERRSAIGLLAHEIAMDQALPLGRAIGFWSALDGAAPERLGMALDQMGLAPLAAVPVRLLSSGQKRRAALARVIAGGAPLWLLDEPGVGLDSASLTLLAAAIHRHRAAGGAVVAATHMDLGLDGAGLLDLGARC